MPDECLPDEHRVPRLIAPSRDTHNNWNDKDPIILEGVLGFTKNRIFDGSLEYFIGDGVHKYSELSKYGGAEASILSKAYTLVLRDANGKIDSTSLPDATPSAAGAVKASTTTAANCVVKADNSGSLDGWKNAIIDAITADNGSGGLVTDPNTGELMVDFLQMPTDKFEDLLKSLKMLIPLSANIDLYVDTNHASAGDTIIDGRGAESLPFKTIQAAVNFVTQTYSLGPYNAIIHIKTGTYDEYLTLPKYTATSGVILLIAHDSTNPPTLTYTTNKATGVVSIIGSKWYLRGLNITKTWESPGGSGYYYPSCLNLNGSDVNVVINGCTFDCEYSGPAHQTVFVGRVIGLYNAAQLTIQAYEGLQTAFTVDKGNGSIEVFFVGGQSQVSLPGYNFTDNNFSGIIPVTGTASQFLTCDNKGFFSIIDGSPNNQVFNNNLTGKKYQLFNGSVCYAPRGGLPGDTSGSVDSTTYSWYKERS